MPQLKHFPLPDVGEGLTEAEILDWKVKPGDAVSVNQIIVEIETAKASVELPCPFAGQVSELLADTGQTVEVGTPIITIDLDPSGAAAPQEAAPAESEGKIGEESNGRIATLVGYGPRTSSAKRRPRKGSAQAAPAASAAPRFRGTRRAAGRGRASRRRRGRGPGARAAVGARAQRRIRAAGQAAGAQARQGPRGGPARGRRLR